MANHRKQWKRPLTIITLILPFLYTGYLAADRLGVWDTLTGLDLAESAAIKFSQSYAPDASRPVRPDDPEWKPLMNLVRDYSKTKLKQDKVPKVFARLQDPHAVRYPPTGPLDSEWTTPSTPIVLIYTDWPKDDGGAMDPSDYQFVGTIGDLKEWISKAKDARRFLVEDIFLGLFGPLLAIVIFFIDDKVALRHKQPK